eukprot:3461649-Rhodomonas_salina.2
MGLQPSPRSAGCPETARPQTPSVIQLDPRPQPPASSATPARACYGAASTCSWAGPAPPVSRRRTQTARSEDRRP